MFVLYIVYTFLDVGFCFFKQKTAYEMRISDWSSDVCSSDLAWPWLARPAKAKRKPEQLLAELAHYGEGDYVVHVDHGIGRYDGLDTLTVNGASHDCLRLIYEGGDKLFVPVENIHFVSRYVSGDTLAHLARLAGPSLPARQACSVEPTFE